MFQVLNEGGDRVLRPFLQDVVQWLPLTQTLAQTGLRYPKTIAAVIPQVGIEALIDWTQHYLGLTGYRALVPISQALAPLLTPLKTIGLGISFGVGNKPCAMDRGRIILSRELGMGSRE